MSDQANIQPFTDYLQGELAQTQTPVIDLVIRWDGRTNEAGLYVIGAQVNPDTVYKLLEMGREWIRAWELAQAMKQVSQPAGDGPGSESGA